MQRDRFLIAAVRAHLVVLADGASLPSHGAGGSFGAALERAEALSRTSDGGPGGGRVPPGHRDDGWRWRVCGRDPTPVTEELVESAISRLDPESRAVLTLTARMSASEAAETLGLTPSQLRRRVTTANQYVSDARRYYRGARR